MCAAPASALADYTNPLTPRKAHFPTKAKACIYLYMYGGPSQMDLFDYKPELVKNHGKTIDIEMRRRAIRKEKILGPVREFKRRGQSGLWCSNAFPHLSQHMDKMAVIKSLYMDSFAHGSANIQMNSGRVLQGHPALGAWIAHGLGSANKNLPSFVVMLDPRGGPIPGAANWTSGYMPAAYQGPVLRSSGNPILNLASRSVRTREMQGERIDAINALNGLHIRSRKGYSELAARIASYDLAYQLQSTAPEALDISSESEKTREMYGLYDKKPDHSIAISPAHFGRQCLVARRLVERGVRFVHVLSGNQSWDHHHGIKNSLPKACQKSDRPIAGLVKDLKRLGLLDSTVVHWGGEIGRLPVVQSRSKPGRDHNGQGFSTWLAGGGFKGGTIYGETDEVGHRAAVDKVTANDYQATLLHQFGLDHEQLTFHHGGQSQKLTNGRPARVVKEIVG